MSRLTIWVDKGEDVKVVVVQEIRGDIIRGVACHKLKGEIFNNLEMHQFLHSQFRYYAQCSSRAHHCCYPLSSMNSTMP